MNKDKISKKRLHSWIWSSYLRTALIPLFILQFIVVIVYFITFNWTRTEMIDVLGDDVVNELQQNTAKVSDMIEQQLSSISNATNQYAILTGKSLLKEPQANERYRLAMSSEGAYYTTKDSDIGGAAVFYSGYFPVEEEEMYKVDKIMKTQELMRAIYESQPLAAAIYFNTYDSLNIIYPYFDVLEQYPAGMDIPAYNFYYEADSSHNPERNVVWTDVYLDPAGNGWMVSSVAPVYNDNFLEGVVGIDITVSTVIENILAVDVPYNGYVLMVGKDGNILALPEAGEEDFQLNELTDHSYEQAILQDTFKPDDFNIYKNQQFEGLLDDILSDSNGYGTIEIGDSTRTISWNTIEATGWKVFFVVENKTVFSEINSMNNRLMIIGVIIVIFLLLIYSIITYTLWMRSRKMSDNISSPLTGMNEILQRIAKGRYYQEVVEVDVVELQETYDQIIEMGSQLGNANHRLLQAQDELRNSESYLRAMINSIDDLVLEVDENGVFINIWSKENIEELESYIETDKNRIDLIFDHDKAREYLEKINRVIATGQSESLEYVFEDGNESKWYMARISLVDTIKRRVVVSSRDISERKKMESHLVEAKIEAENANKAKSAFLSSMSHELRTPMNAILGFAQILEMDRKNPLSDDQKMSLQHILKAGEHLLSLINEVLDFSKIESGKVSLSMEAANVENIVNETVDMVSSMARKKDVDIKVQFQEVAHYYIAADFTRIKQILINLLSNAVKYNRDNGLVKYFGDRSGDKIRFHVVDSGLGIPKDQIENIFKPFYRVDESSHTIEGTGIGLAVAKQLTEIMGGNIYVESNVGMGSHFWIEFPIQDHQEISDHEITKEAVNTSIYTTKEIHEVLYIEDNPANLQLVEKILDQLPNVHLISATSGENCLDMAIAHQPSLVLLDINLPGISGLEVMKLLKNHENTMNIPVLAVSANALPADIERAKSQGFDEYITKPIVVSDFMMKVEKYLIPDDQL